MGSALSAAHFHSLLKNPIRFRDTLIGRNLRRV